VKKLRYSIPLIALVAVALIRLCCADADKEALPRTKIAIAGSYCDSIIVIDKLTQKIERRLPLPIGDRECNSVSVDENGSILFSYRRGARLLSKDSLVVWDVQRLSEQEEVQTTQIIEGGYLIAVCGSPAYIAETDKLGNKHKIVRFDTSIKDHHSQFRQVSKAKNGNYLVPLMGNKQVWEINDKGETVKIFNVGPGAFCVEEQKDGNLMIVAAGKISIYDRATTKEIKVLTTAKKLGAAFLTQASLLDNGNLMVSNWQGHSDNDNNWQIIELDPEGNIVWEFKNKKSMKYVSAFYVFEN